MTVRRIFRVFGFVLFFFGWSQVDRRPRCDETVLWLSNWVYHAFVFFLWSDDAENSKNKQESKSNDLTFDIFPSCRERKSTDQLNVNHMIYFQLSMYHIVFLLLAKRNKTKLEGVGSVRGPEHNKIVRYRPSVVRFDRETAKTTTHPPNQHNYRREINRMGTKRLPSCELLNHIHIRRE